MKIDKAIKILSGDIIVLNLHNNPALYNRNKAHEMAIQALKKQIPKKPEVNEFDYGDGYVCGECESFLHYVDDDDEHIRTNYCCHCGTKIDWQ